HLRALNCLHREDKAGSNHLIHDTCLGYYDVSGQFDKEFGCNNTDHRFCCGSCFLRFCCADRGKRLEQTFCTNYNTERERETHTHTHTRALPACLPGCVCLRVSVCVCAFSCCTRVTDQTCPIWPK
uniref:Shisa N-terminal domain-containing protein n=1 Tax=Hippocampus comes TaxID=109280 RepID=A0A3Q3D7Z1_HIPCM